MESVSIPFEGARAAGTELMVPVAPEVSLCLAWCPAGEFLMGSPEADPLASGKERPQHRVTVSRGFWIGRTPVTQGLWQAIVATKLKFARGGPEGDLLPVEAISWSEAVEFCARLTGRLRRNGGLAGSARVDLPTEAQWEYACRAGTQTRWFFGDDEQLLAAYGWYADNSGDRTHPVQKLAPNPWGLFDVCGNVAEWCRDDLHLYSVASPRAEQPYLDSEASVLKMARGGSYAEQARGCRSASRESVQLDNAYNEPVGFRVVCVDDA
jgi:formylglycine-generating enzyme required for sulfatase activity